jgi:hypothetical protein
MKDDPQAWMRAVLSGAPLPEKQQDPSTGNDALDVIQGAFAGGLAGMAETAQAGVGALAGREFARGTIGQVSQGLRGIQQRNLPSPEARGTFLGEYFPSAVGSVGSFMLPVGPLGAALRVGRIGSGVLGSLAGVAQAAGPAYYEAKGRGLSEPEAWTAFLAQGAGGATEGLGAVVPGIGKLGAWMAGVNQRSGGALARGVATAMAREFGQETGQGLIDSVIDRDLMEYPEAQQDLLEILKDRAVQEGLPAAVLGALFGAVEVATAQTPRADVGTDKPAVGQESAQRTDAEPGAPQVELTPEDSAALDSFRRDTGAADAELVEPPQEYGPAIEFARRRGHTVRTVRGPVEGYFEPDTGTIFVSEGLAPDAAMSVVRGHEMAHALRSRDAGTWDEFRASIVEADPEGVAAYEATASERYKAATGRDLTQDVAQEEGVSYWTQHVLSPWLRETESNPARLARLAVDNRNMFQRIVEAGLDLLNSFGAKFKTRAAEMRELRKALGAGERLTVEQGRALADRYMRAMGGLEAEFGAQESAALTQQMQGAPLERGAGADAMLESEQMIGGEQAIEAMRRGPAMLPAAPVEGVRRAFEPVSPTVQRQLGVGRLRTQVAVNQSGVALGETQEQVGAREMAEPKPAKEVEVVDAEGNVTGTMREPRFAFSSSLNEAIADSPLRAHIGERAKVYRAAAARMYRAFVDALEPVRAELPKVYDEETLRRSATGERINKLVKPRQEKFSATLKKHGIKLDEIGEFLKARGAVLRNRYMEQINKDPETGEDIGGLSGMTDQEAAEILARVRADSRYKGFVELANQYDEINQITRDTWRTSGDKKAEEIDRIEKAYSPEAARELGIADPDNDWKSYYVAFRTAADEEVLEGLSVGAGPQGTGRGLSAGGDPTKRAFGRRSEASNPVPFAFVDLESAIIRAGKLDTLRTVARSVEARANPEFARVVSIPTKRGINPETGVVEDIPDPAWRSRPDTVAFKESDGKLRAIIFSRKYAYLAPILKGETMTKAVPGINTLTRTMGGLLTRWNPAFFLTNYWRDLFQVTLAAHAKQGRAFAADVLKGQRSAMRDLYRAEFGGEVSARMQEYRESGARIGTYGFQDYASTAKQIESDLTSGKVRDAAQATKRLIEGFNDIAENATRFAVYNAARDRGMPIEKAALLAKQEIGVNFERRGEFGPLMSSLYAFANAGIQGNANALSAIGTQRGAQAVGAIAAFGVLVDQMNRALSGDDEDGEPIYDNRPEWQKNASLLIETGGGGVVQIPMPHGWRWFYNIGRRMSAGVLSGQYDAKDVAELAFMEAFDTVSPLGAGPLEQIAAPTVADPLVQLSTNRAWTGKRIAPENLPFGAQKPASQLYWRNTPDLPVEIARILSEATQFDDSGVGELEFSPNHIEHFLRAAVGGLGSTIVSASNNATELAQGKLPRAADTVFLNRFYGEASPWAIDTRFSEARKEIESVKARYDELRKAGEGARALEWRKANMPLFQAIGAMKLAERQLSSIPNTVENEERRRAVKARFNAHLRKQKT